MVAGGIHSNQWRNYIRDIFRVLRPGGWCQMVEVYFNAQSDNGTLTPGKLDRSRQPCIHLLIWDEQIMHCRGGRTITWRACNHTRTREPPFSWPAG